MSVKEAASQAGGYQALPAPRVSLGLPQRIRVWIQEFLLELARAGVSHEEAEHARATLQSPELARYLAGGEPAEYDEEKSLRTLVGFGEVIKNDLRDRGYKIPK